MTKVSRKPASRLPPRQRMEDIMAAARAVIAEKGYENTLMQDIADRAGVVEGTLYRFFKTKQELLIRVAEDWFEEQMARDSGVDSIQGVRNKLRHLIWRALMITREQPVLSRYQLTEIRPNPDYRNTRFYELNRRFTGEIRRVCEEAIRTGEFRNDVSAVLLRDMVFGCIEHQTWAYLRGEGDFAVDDVADGITEVLYRGMAVKPEVAPDRLDQVVERLEYLAERLEGRLKH